MIKNFEKLMQKSHRDPYRILQESEEQKRKEYKEEQESGCIRNQNNQIESNNQKESKKNFNTVQKEHKENTRILTESIKVQKKFQEILKKPQNLPK